MRQLTGPSGARKTTLVNLLPRFLDPGEGTVQIDGHDVRRLRLASMRKQIGYVPQDPVLLPVSIAENIVLGQPDANREEIERTARLAKAHGFVVTLEDGYDTVVGERGATLSGGQRQRITIARGLLLNASVMIYDEPTSALDPETEEALLRKLQKARNGKTTIEVTHREIAWSDSVRQVQLTLYELRRLHGSFRTVWRS